MEQYLSNLTKTQLIDIAIENNLKVNRKLTKDQLIILLERKLAPLKDISHIYDSIRYESIKYMDLDTIKNLALTNKFFASILNDQYLFTYLLSRDFGSNLVTNNYANDRSTYLDLYNKRNFIVSKFGQNIFNGYSINTLLKKSIYELEFEILNPSHDFSLNLYDHFSSSEDEYDEEGNTIEHSSEDQSDESDYDDISDEEDAIKSHMKDNPDSLLGKFHNEYQNMINKINKDRNPYSK